MQVEESPSLTVITPLKPLSPVHPCRYRESRESAVCHMGLGHNLHHDRFAWQPAEWPCSRPQHSHLHQICSSTAPPLCGDRDRGRKTQCHPLTTRQPMHDACMQLSFGCCTQK